MSVCFSLSSRHRLHVFVILSFVFLSLVSCLCLPVFVFLSSSSCLCLSAFDFMSFCLCILPVQNGNLVAQDLRLIHVVSRHQDRAVLLVLQHQVPNVP